MRACARLPVAWVPSLPWATAYAPTEGWPALRVCACVRVVFFIYLYIKKMVLFLVDDIIDIYIGRYVM